MLAAIMPLRNESSNIGRHSDQAVAHPLSVSAPDILVPVSARPSPHLREAVSPSIGQEFAARSAST